MGHDSGEGLDQGQAHGDTVLVLIKALRPKSRFGKNPGGGCGSLPAHDPGGIDHGIGD